MKNLNVLAALSALTAAGESASKAFGNIRVKPNVLSDNHVADKNKKKKRKQAQKSRRKNRKK